MMKAVEERLGIGGLPPAVDAKTFEAMDKKGKFEKVVYRGLIDSGDITVDKMVKQYQSSKDMYIGQGIYAHGTYTNPDVSLCADYGDRGMRLGIDKKAKIVNYEKIYLEFKKFLRDDANNEAWFKFGWVS